MIEVVTGAIFVQMFIILSVFWHSEPEASFFSTFSASACQILA